MENGQTISAASIYILLSNTYSLITRAIGLYTGDPYNHVSIAFDCNLDEMFSFGRLQPKNPLIGGFVQESVDSGTFAHFPETECALYQLPVTDEQWQTVRAKVREFEREKDKYSYNFIGFAGVAAGFPIDRQYAYFCSQFVSAVLQAGGLKLFCKPCGLVTPADFQSLEQMTLVYEGKLADYRRATLSTGKNSPLGEAFDLQGERKLI